LQESAPSPQGIDRPAAGLLNELSTRKVEIGSSTSRWNPLASNAERPATVELGTNELIGDDLGRAERLVERIVQS
jgi:hypothetical protein